MSSRTAIARSSSICTAALLITACDPTPPPPPSAVSLISNLEYCELAGLPKPMRQTIILLDSRAVASSADAAEFATKNRAIRDLIMSVVDPDQATSSGVTAPRERVTIGVLPSDGSPAILAFTGCLPGMTPDELQAARDQVGALKEWTTGDVETKLSDLKDGFRKSMLAGLMSVAGKADGSSGAESGQVEQAKLFESLRNSQSILRKTHDFDNLAQRLVVYSDVTGLKMPVAMEGAAASLRKQGIAAGKRSGGDFGLSEIVLVAPEGRAPANREFFEGYVLAQGGVLTAYSSGKVSAISPAPGQLWNFTGTADYPSRKESIRVRIGTDGAGKLVSSWLTLVGDPVNRSTPLSGRIECSGDRRCKVVADDGGFSQAWGPSPGGDPEFASEMPFGGMRMFEFSLSGKALTGKVYDEAVIISDDGKNSIQVTAESK